MYKEKEVFGIQGKEEFGVHEDLCTRRRGS